MSNSRLPAGPLPQWVRYAIELRWQDPLASWEGIVERCGHQRQQLWRWRKTEQFEVAMREQGMQHASELAPEAMAALRKAWSRGNSQGAVDVLRSLAYLLGERTETTVHLKGNVGEQITELERELGITKD